MTFKTYTIKNFLSEARNMPEEALATVTDEELSAYELEYSEYKDAQQEDVVIARDLATVAKDNIKQLFGVYSKEHRYFDRKVCNGEDLVSVHGNKYPSPRIVKDLVSDAKERTEITAPTTASAVITDQTLEGLDTAIAFLQSKGFAYGKDFSAHNAVDIAESMAVQSVIENPTRIEVVYADGSDEDIKCSNCDGLDFSASLSRYLSDSEAECDCGSTSYSAKIAYQVCGKVGYELGILEK